MWSARPFSRYVSFIGIIVADLRGLSNNMHQSDPAGSVRFAAKDGYADTVN